ncbi:helix-turn-helix transcriptional regulator [Microbacterium maritypicum]|uniref:helix-turn-helix domain-containing protein n=1 Tax=Microbacterium maritypicum TaxID=33918 RepID=UPI003556A462
MRTTLADRHEGADHRSHPDRERRGAVSGTTGEQRLESRRPDIPASGGGTDDTRRHHARRQRMGCRRSGVALGPDHGDECGPAGPVRWLPRRYSDHRRRPRRRPTRSAHGLSNPEISERLHLTPATVKTHVNRVVAKLYLRDRAHAVILG